MSVLIAPCCLQQRAADESTRPQVIATLDAAAALKIGVIRSWAFIDGASQWNAVQPAAGVFNENVLKALDWLLVACRERGLKLMLCLNNYWHDFGGMKQYVR